MYAKNTEAISAYARILEGKISTLNSYSNGISDIMGDYPNLRKTHIQEDSEALRDLLVSICHNGLEGSLEAVQGKINEMLDTVSSIAEGGGRLCLIGQDATGASTGIFCMA